MPHTCNAARSHGKSDEIRRYPVKDATYDGTTRLENPTLQRPQRRRPIQLIGPSWAFQIAENSDRK